MIQNETAGSVFVDAFSGTGAVGIEALSRGSACVFFLENNRKTLALLEKNLAECCSDENYRIFSLPVLRSLDLVYQDSPVVDIIFLDPPYDFPGHPELLSKCVALFPNALIILEASTRSVIQIEHPLILRKERKIGETKLLFYGLAGSDSK
jgi:16S rRNA (guanine(966)-N(2))-methyltransferase RsmD